MKETLEKRRLANLTGNRSSHWEVFSVKGVPRNFVKFTGKHLCQSLFFNKVAGLKPATLLKKRIWHRCFPVNFEKFLRTSFFIEHLRWLLLWGTKYWLKSKIKSKQWFWGSAFTSKEFRSACTPIFRNSFEWLRLLQPVHLLKLSFSETATGEVI